MQLLPCCSWAFWLIQYPWQWRYASVCEGGSLLQRKQVKWCLPPTERLSSKLLQMIQDPRSSRRDDTEGATHTGSGRPPTSGGKTRGDTTKLITRRSRWRRFSLQFRLVDVRRALCALDDELSDRAQRLDPASTGKLFHVDFAPLAPSSNPCAFAFSLRGGRQE
jgi:hypothetical protein